MKNILLSALFIFIFACISYGQVAVPTVDLGSAPATVTGTEARLGRIEIEIADSGLNDTRVKLFANIGKTSNAQTDPLTGLYLFQTLDNKLIFDGKISELLVMITRLSDQNTANNFATEFVKIFYNPLDNKGLVVQFNSLTALLLAANPTLLKPAIKAQ